MTYTICNICIYVDQYTMFWLVRVRLRIWLITKRIIWEE